ncbi:MAG TPA: phosphoribosylformylglycinamidine synthase subunit PurQ, partial [Paenalcaligenes sp.]|nr:phosphoribosylformylglycinamidine synthase subunit PurQ [Paenalcaligenes sp.]
YANFDLQGDQASIISVANYVDNRGQVTEQYPFNPNGSPQGLAGATTADGRFTILMPHPERVSRNVTMSWAPQRWSQADTGGVEATNGGFTPWIRLFQNARVWIG